MSVLFDSLIVRGFIAVLCAVFAGQACAQQPLAPPVNHESGTISEVLTAQDAGYRQIGYVVRWRGSQVFVTGSPHAAPRSGRESALYGLSYGDGRPQDTAVCSQSSAVRYEQRAGRVREFTCL